MNLHIQPMPASPENWPPLVEVGPHSPYTPGYFEVFKCSNFIIFHHISSYLWLCYPKIWLFGVEKIIQIAIIIGAYPPSGWKCNFSQLCLRSSIGNTISKTKTKLMKEIWPQLDETKNKLQQSRGNSNALKVNLLIGMIPAVYLHLFYTFFRDFFCDPFWGETQSKNFTDEADYGTSGMVWNLLGVASPAWGSSDRYIMPPQTWTNNIVEGLMRIGPASIWEFIWIWLCKLGELQKCRFCSDPFPHWNGLVECLFFTRSKTFFPHRGRN